MYTYYLFLFINKMKELGMKTCPKCSQSYIHPKAHSCLCQNMIVPIDSGGPIQPIRAFRAPLLINAIRLQYLNIHEVI